MFAKLFIFLFLEVVIVFDMGIILSHRTKSYISHFMTCLITICSIPALNVHGQSLVSSSCKLFSANTPRGWNTRVNEREGLYSSISLMNVT